MGAVYEGQRISDGQRIAIKVLSQHAKADATAIARFEREAVAASRLGHPNIVRVYDFRRPQNEPPFLVMELIEGHSLGDEIEAMGALDAKRVARIAEEALSALSAAHAASIVHRDIKPDNIVLLREPVHVQTKLVDFGVAKVAGAEQLTQAGQIVGTPAYMAPEQWHGRAVDARTDFYALGGCLYHALIGKPAVSSAVEALQPGFAAGRALDMPKLRPDVPDALANAIAKALSEEPRDRYSTAVEMAAAIGKAMPHTTAAMPTLRQSAGALAVAATEPDAPVLHASAPPTARTPSAPPTARTPSAPPARMPSGPPTPMPMPSAPPARMPSGGPMAMPSGAPMPMPSAPPARMSAPSWNAPSMRAPTSGPSRGAPASSAPMGSAMKSLLVAGAIIVALGYLLRDTCLGLISRAAAPKK
jgi:serine/threonine-protein kinase